MFLSFFRTIKFSIQDIYRNIWLSIVTIIILILALFSVNMLLTVKVIGDAAIGAVKDKIDVSLYLQPTAPEEEILALKTQIGNLTQVESVRYVTREEALEFFKMRHEGNSEVLESLRELGRNPLTPTLIIKPKDVDELEDLIANLNKFDSDIIESRNFTNYKNMLVKINNITDKVSEIGILISLVFLFITLLVVYNSVRVAIYTHRQEIMIMRLVGASNSFIYMPFMFSSIIYTLVGVGALVGIFYPFLTLLQPYLETFFIGYNINIVDYFMGNFWVIFGGQFVVAVFVNGLASLIAVRKYADV